MNFRLHQDLWGEVWGSLEPLVIPWSYGLKEPRWGLKERFPELSYADLWTLGGCQAIKLMGGPDIPFEFGRKDDADGTNCPMNGRLPDAALGAEHLREVFYRMGFNDQDIVALSGAVSVGCCVQYCCFFFLLY